MTIQDFEKDLQAVTESAKSTAKFELKKAGMSIFSQLKESIAQLLSAHSYHDVIFYYAIENIAIQPNNIVTIPITQLAVDVDSFPKSVNYLQHNVQLFMNDDEIVDVKIVLFRLEGEDTFKVVIQNTSPVALFIEKGEIRFVLQMKFPKSTRSFNA